MLWFDIPDELLPPAYSSIKDMYAYARTLDTELRNFLYVMYYIRGNFFVQTCDTETLTQWIALLNIPLYGGESTEEKRELVLMYLNNQKPATEPFFRSMLDQFFGSGNYTYEIPQDDPLSVVINFTHPDYILVRRFGDWFVRMVSAHILWKLGMLFPTESTVVCSTHEIAANVATCRASMSISSETLYLGSQEYEIQTVEL